MADRKMCTIIGSDKGGVGKSMISQIMTLVFDNAKFPLRVIEIDNQKKLSSVLGSDRINLSLSATPDLQELSRKRHTAESFFNPAYMEWVKDNSVTDLGANVTTSLFAWIRHCQILELAAEDQIDFKFVSCASPDEQALRSALSAIKDAQQTFAGTATNHYLVLNELAGNSGFSPYRGTAIYQELLEQQAAGKMQILEVPYCDSILLEHGRAMGLNLVQVVHQASTVAAAAGLDLVSERVHKRKMISWMKDTQTALTPLFNVERAAAA